MESNKKFVYFFSEHRTDGDKTMKATLGGKGAGLAEMAKLKLPVPPGFTIITETCDEFYKNGKKIPENVLAEVESNLAELEHLTGKKFGDHHNPLLVAVRSGAAISMPGMMDTVLNLGLNEHTLEGLIKKTNNPRFGWDAYRRFVQMFSSIVLGIKGEKFSSVLDAYKKHKGFKLDIELDVDDLKHLAHEFKKIAKHETGEEFPCDVKKQLIMGIEAVFNSWNSDRANAYRRLNDIKGLKGTAVTVICMVFGNMGNTSGTGVAFTRDPNTGEKKVYGECLLNAQGEDVVAGIRTPLSLEKLGETLPNCLKQFYEIADKLEHHYKDMQDLEFTIEEEKLYMLQTRNGKRTGLASINIAIDLFNEGILTQEEAILRIDPNSLNQLLHPGICPTERKSAHALGKGLAASPGAAIGKVVFDAHEAKRMAEKKEKVILVRLETSPEDIEGMNAAQGILTARGGLTSHAAVVARGMGRPCVCGCSDIEEFSEEHKYFIIKGKKISEGDVITLDGSTGEVFEGSFTLIRPDPSTGNFKILMEWADKYRKLKLRANADTPKDAETAMMFGAEGIGLCRTEHMFFKKERISVVRQMILTESAEYKAKCLETIQGFQKEDFVGLFSTMSGRPVTIRLLDPPLHEFLPSVPEEIEELAKLMGVTVKDVHNKIDELHEFNPMLGHRGCRLGITQPEISTMQCRAIFEAAAETNCIPEIMVPLVGFKTELVNQKAIVEAVYKEVTAKLGKDIPYVFGTMIEVPRGALVADQIALEADFFSFGTNDLTQMGCGLSRDDAGKFLKYYVAHDIVPSDPFNCLDREGVGQLMEIAVRKGKSVKEHLKLGICGEHGGEPSSVEFCHMLGLSYVSCSPYRVPVARLAAAQAALRHEYGCIIHK